MLATRSDANIRHDEKLNEEEKEKQINEAYARWKLAQVKDKNG